MTRLTLTLLQAALLGLVINIRVQAQVNEKDSLALVALYHATGGTKWSDNTNWLAGEPANWVGVEVTDDSVNVLKLSFRDNKLTGAIPTELGNLTKLTALNLSFNPLSGSLPLSLTNLKNLTFFDFSETFLCEPSNPTFQTWLQDISTMHSTGVTCGRTVARQDSSALVALYHATGGTEWSDNTNWLTWLVVFWKGVTVIDNRVRRLDLSNNHLKGTIQNELDSLTYLKGLFLSHNQLNGRIPALIPEYLVALNVSHNKLEGLIPKELAKATTLEVLNLSHNQLTGTIPEELTNLALTELDVSHNDSLTGTIPKELVALTFYDNTGLKRPPSFFNRFFKAVLNIFRLGKTAPG